MTGMSVMDICSYCDLATESIRKSIDTGNYDGAHIQLAAYLLEVYTRYQSGEINAEAWQETLRFYRRMTISVMDESSIQQ